MFVDQLWVMFGVEPIPGFPHRLLVSYKTSTPARMGMILDPPLLSGRPIMKFISEWCHCQQQQQQQQQPNIQLTIDMLIKSDKP